MRVVGLPGRWRLERINKARAGGEHRDLEVCWSGAFAGSCCAFTPRVPGKSRSSGPSRYAYRPRRLDRLHQVPCLYADCMSEAMYCTRPASKLKKTLSGEGDSVMPHCPAGQSGRSVDSNGVVGGNWEPFWRPWWGHDSRARQRPSPVSASTAKHRRPRLAQHAGSRRIDTMEALNCAKHGDWAFYITSTSNEKKGPVDRCLRVSLAKEERPAALGRGRGGMYRHSRQRPRVDRLACPLSSPQDDPAARLRQA